MRLDAHEGVAGGIVGGIVGGIMGGGGVWKWEESAQPLDSRFGEVFHFGKVIAL